VTGEHADVLVIGAGASGAVAALRLAEAGFDVVCLEQGDWPDRASFRGAEDDWELAARKQWSAIPSIRQAPADYPIDLTESDVGVLNFNGVGGGTVLYAAQWPRLLPCDFRARSWFGFADDWPLSYDELLPYYERVDRAFGVSGLGGNPAYPPGADPPLPPLPIGAAGLRVARAHARLGWHWWPEANAILSGPYAGRRPCVQRATCTQGCGEGAKASTDLTHWPAAIASGARLVTGACARELTCDRRGLVNGAVWVDVDGNEHFQGADVVLCAANGIGTPRLLLASASNRQPDGLANSSGLVGRGLMVHLLGALKGLFDESLMGWQGHNGGAILSYEFYGTDEARGFVGAAKWSLTPTGGPLAAALARGGEWGPCHHRHVLERFGCSTQWGLICEDLPDDDNRVELSGTLTDAFGMAAPKLVYRIAENTHRLFDWHVERASESLTEAGARSTELAARYPPNGHFLGTARMGDDPGRSVVDRWSMTHDVPNLGILDGSVFVTAGGANPTSTIAALALRTVEHVIAHRASMPVPERDLLVRVGAAAPRALHRRPHGTAVPTAFDAEERRRFGALADAAIPAGDGMPSATEIDIAGPPLDRVLAALPQIEGDVRRAVAGPVDDPATRLAVLKREDPAAHRALVLAVAGGYYLDAGVRARLGYEGQLALRVQGLDFPEYVSEGLLDPILEAWDPRAHGLIRDDVAPARRWSC
jgi:choline dehydrogenase-like flavoprotein